MSFLSFDATDSRSRSSGSRSCSPSHSHYPALSSTSEDLLSDLQQPVPAGAKRQALQWNLSIADKLVQEVLSIRDRCPLFRANDSDFSQSGYPDINPLFTTKQPATCLHWVRMSSLRIHDNAALKAAMETENMQFRAVFIYDPWFECGENFGLNRWRFLIESLEDLDKSLQSYGTRLYVVKGQPLAMLEKLCSRWNVKSLTYQIDKDVGSHILEQSLDSLLKKLDITVSKFEGHTLYNTANILRDHPSIMTLKDFKSVISSCGPPESPLDPPSTRLSASDLTLPSEYRIPTLQDVGFSAQDTVRTHDHWLGGETVALQKVVKYVQTRTKETKLNVGLLLDKSSLSPYIRFGCLSVRYLFWKVKELASHVDHFYKHFVSGILNREFYFTVASQVPDFDCYNSEICVRLPWHEDKEMLRLWRSGKTGFPWIDAAMRQLWQEGWIHHVLRESVAFFLTRGELWQSWEQGRKVFWELQLDYENSVSSGCWLKSSASAFISEQMEYYCPVTYGIKIDPTGEYIRTYIPELKNFPNEYIYCPWMAPLKVQEEAKCRIGVDYPLPIINHITTGALCQLRLQTIMTLLHTVNNKTETESQCRVAPPQPTSLSSS